MMATPQSTMTGSKSSEALSHLEAVVQLGIDDQRNQMKFAMVLHFVCPPPGSKPLSHCSLLSRGAPVEASVIEASIEFRAKLEV